MNWQGILVYAENYSGSINRASFELLGKARELIPKVGGDVYAAVVTNKESVERHSKELVAFGADKVIVYTVEEMLLPNPVVHRAALINAISYAKPKLVLVPATPWGRSIAPRVAAAIGTGITADCLDVYIDENGDVVQVRPAFTGNIIAHIKTLTNPVMATVRPGVFPLPQPRYDRKGEVIVRDVGVPNADRVKVLGVSKRKAVKLSEAEVIVAIGRGVKSKEDVKLFEELAKALKAQLACSRPLVDMGWMERDRQVGFSGSIVKPKLYIALGISGAPQHIAGMKDSKYIIAVNIDQSAPIVKYSDLVVIGDIYDIAKKLLHALKSSQF